MQLNFSTQRPPARSRLLRFLLGLVLVLGLNLSTAPSSSAQLTLPEGFGQSQAIGLPDGVTRYGNLETSPVESPLSVKQLFTVASPTIYDRSPAALAGKQPVEQRVEEIQARLLLLLNRPMDPETLILDVSQINNIKIIRAQDQTFTQPLVLMSVTELDSQYNGIPVDQLAEQWRETLEQELRTGLQKLPQDRQRVLQILLILLLLTGVTVGLKYSLSRRQTQLRQQKQALKRTSALTEPEQPRSERPPAELTDPIAQTRTDFLQQLQRLFSLDRQLSALDFLQWLLFWLLILAWYGGVVWVAMVSPYLIRNQFKFIEIPLDLLSTWFFIGLMIRLSRYLIDRFIAQWQNSSLMNLISLGDSYRRQLRAATIAGAMKGLVTLVWLTLGLLWALGSLGLPTASAVAILSVLALAISLGSRRLVEDLVNGFLILAEDQFAIGDVIDLGNVSGLVENLNLRITQLRNSSGQLITIPNNRINEVRNLTRDWSRVDFSIDVDYYTDPDRAIAVLQNVAQTLYQDPDWHDKILSEPTVCGIDQVSHQGMTITVLIQTAPAQQWAVGREFRLRVRRALADHGINIGIPRTYTLETAAQLQESTDGIERK